jgi:hypothetical protein
MPFFCSRKKNISETLDGLGVGGLLKPKTVCLHQGLLIAQTCW